MKRKTTDEFIMDAICKHEWLYNYKLVDYRNNSTKIDIICSIHGIFKQTPNKHLNGQGCPKCAITSHSISQTKSVDQFIIDAYSKHCDTYGYERVVYNGRTKKVEIRCKNHGYFWQRASNHLQGWGCKACGYDITTSKQTLNQNDVINIMISLHNGYYDYSEFVYTTKKNKSKIICPVHGAFEQIVENHMYGQGCPKCVNHISKSEIELQDWLSQYIDIECNDRTLISPLELDIVIPSKKIAIEYNGLYWHSEQQGKDRRYHLNKHNLCKDKGYRLIQIWENEWLLYKSIVKSIILNAIGKHTNKIHGRKCEIRTITPKEARPFYNNNHIQGFQGGEHHGLYYKGELVSLMTYKSYNQYYMLERFVNKRNTIVHGAFTKLLKSFPCDKNVITFADLRYFIGGVYDSNGFEFIHQTKPNYWYFRNSTINMIHRRSFQKKRIEDKYNKGQLEFFDASLTESENMTKNKYHRIWDCGNLKFEMKSNL